MLYGAPRQSGLLAADLRAGARKAADRDRTLRAAEPTTAERRPTAPAGARHSILAALLRHVHPAPTAHTPAR